MKTKYVFMAIFVIAAISFCVIASEDSDESDADTTYTVTIATNNSSYGTVSPTTIRVSSGAVIDDTAGTMNQIKIGNTMVTATPHAETLGYSYRLVGWNGITSTVTSDMTITALFTRDTVETCTVTVVSNNTNYGTVSPSTVTVNKGWGMDETAGSSNQIKIGNTMVTATPHADTSSYTYRLVGWNNITSNITSDMTVTANFARTAVIYYTVSIVPNNSDYGSVSPTSVSVSSGTAITLSNQNPNVLTIGSNVVTATPNPDTSQYTHSFVGWNGITSTVTSDMTITARFAAEELYAVTIVPNNADYGTVSPSIVRVTGGTVIDDTAGTMNQIKIGDIFVTATPHEDTAQYTYSLFGWNGITSTVTSDMTITAMFSRTAVSVPEVYWSNDMYNGSVSIAFRFSGGSNNMDHHMTIPLYTGETNSQQETTWTDTGKELEISISYPSTVITLELIEGNNNLMSPITVNAGMWKAFVLTINTDQGKLLLTPIDTFNDFTNFKTMTEKEKVIADWSSITHGNTIFEIIHEDTGNGAHVSMQVVNTETFLNTFGVVLTNPSINVFDYFPDLTAARLNFYAFALYGDSMTINGTTFPVDEEGRVQVTYTSNSRDTEHWIALPGTEGAKTSSFALSNIYVTWQDGKVSLTFVDDKFTVDLGSFSAGDESVSFTGYWYFTTMLNEPYTVTEKVITGDWKTLPNIGGPAMLLIFLGVILIGGMIAHVKIGLKWLDFAIVGVGLIVTFTLFGVN